MKKGIFVICIISLLLIVSTIGCFEEEKKGNNDDDTDDDATGETYTWTIKEFLEDQNVSFSTTGITIVYDTLENGDTLILEDKIPENLTYNSTGDYTEIPLAVPGNESSQTTYTYITGNITDEFSPGTNFRLTVTIKYVNVTLNLGEGQNATIEMETFEEQWKSEETFKTAYEAFLSGEEGSVTDAFSPMPQSVIEKT